MKRITYLLLACFLTCAIFSGCKEDPKDEILTKPVFVPNILDSDDKPTWSGIYDGRTPFPLSINLSSDFDLVSLKVETVVGTAATEVETITHFANPKSYVYQRDFVLPSEVLSMNIRLTAENVKGLSTVMSFTLRLNIEIDVQEIVNCLAEAYSTWWNSPDDVPFPTSFNIDGISLDRSQMYGLACQTLLILTQNSTAKLEIFSYRNADNPGLDGFRDEEVSIHMMVNQSTRQMTFARNNSIWANFVGYPSTYQDPDGKTYQGEFSFNRSFVCLARLFDEFKRTGALPAVLSSAFVKFPPEIIDIGLPLTAVVNAMADIYERFISFDEDFPKSITIAGEVLDSAQYFEAAARAILAIRDNNTGVIELTSFGMPAAPNFDSGDPFQEAIIPIELVFNAAQRQLTFAGNNNIFANFVSYPQAFIGPENEVYNGMLTFNRLLVVFARVLAAYKENGELPPTLSSLEQATVDFQKLFIDAYSATYRQWLISGTMPTTMSVNNQTLSIPEYFEAACRVFLNLYHKTNNEITITPYIIPNSPGVDGFEQTEIHIELLENVAARHLTYVTTGGGSVDKILANAVGYPSGNYTGPGTYSGNFSFNRALVVFGRAFDDYRTNDRLPTMLSSAYTITTDLSVSDQQAFVDEFANAYKTFTTTDKLPATITVNGKLYDKQTWFEVACRMLLNINDGKSEPISLSNFGMSDNVNNIRQDTFVEDEVGIELLTNQARRQIAFATLPANRRFANFVGYPNANTANPEDVTVYNGNLSLERGLILMMRAFDAYKTNGILPAKLSSWQSDFLTTTLNCDVDGPKAIETMNEAIAGKTTVEEKARALFEHWLDIRTYEYYYDTRHGSEETLALKVGNCCDLSHALIAMARAAGIPARYVHATCLFVSSGNRIGHVWVELWVDGAWVTCDPSSKSNTYGNHESWSDPVLNSKLAELHF